MKTLNVVVTENCELCDKGMKKINLLKYFFNIQEINVEGIIMAGWMRIVTKKFINAFPDRIINIHPSLLPRHKGLNVVERALDAGDDVTGCTVHYVTEELDSGAIIHQATVPIIPPDTVK